MPPEDPAQWQGKVRFSLDANAPPGANIDRQTGLFLWTPPLAEPAGQQEISVSATGREGQTTQTSFIITVTRPIPVPAPATLPAKGIAVDLGGGVKLELVLIPAGEFMMGSPDSDNNAQGDEKPQHRVRITKPFYLGKYLVTQEQWEAVMGNNPSKFKGPKNPVETVSWDDCQRFFDKLNDKIGGGGSFRCPARRSGNTPAGRGARRAIASGTRSRGWANMRGMTVIQAARRTRWARRSRTPGGCTICTGTCGSGARIGMMAVTKRIADGRSDGAYNGLGPRASRRRLGQRRRGLPLGEPRRLRARGPAATTWACVSPEWRGSSGVSGRSRCAARSGGPGRAVAGQAQAERVARARCSWVQGEALAEFVVWSC